MTRPVHTVTPHRRRWVTLRMMGRIFCESIASPRTTSVITADEYGTITVKRIPAHTAS